MKPGYLEHIRRIGATIAQLARHEITVGELIQKVRQRHPYSTDDDLTKGAFHAVVEAAEIAPEQTTKLHRLAVEVRDSPQLDTAR